MVVVAACLAGCSLSLGGPDPGLPRNRPPECDSSKGLVTLDAIAGSALAIGGLVALGNDAGGEAAVPLAFAAAFYLAAGRGNSVANSCRAAVTEFNEYVANTIVPRDAGPPGRAKRRTEPPMPGNPPPPVTPAVATQPDETDDAVEAAEAPEPPRPKPAAPPPRAPRSANPANPANPAKPPPPAPAPAPAAPAPADPWSEFWKEVP